MLGCVGVDFVSPKAALVGEEENTYDYLFIYFNCFVLKLYFANLFCV